MTTRRTRGVACEGAKCDDVDGDETHDVCVGIRGKGQLIFAHFAALARIVEHSADRTALYDLTTDSAYDLSLREADAVWCTSWNELPASDIARVSDDAYGAPMRTEDPVFTDAADAYPNIDADLDLVGCASRSGVGG